MRNSRKKRRQNNSDIRVQKHDSICDLVADELRQRGYRVEHHREYNNIRSGELDVVGYKGKYALLFEIKYTNRGKNKNKANNQLKRAETYCNWLQGYKTFKFYAYHVDDTYKIEWIPHKTQKYKR